MRCSLSVIVVMDVRALSVHCPFRVRPQVRWVLREYIENLGDSDGEEEKGRLQGRLRRLAKLTYAEGARWGAEFGANAEGCFVPCDGDLSARSVTRDDAEMCLPNVLRPRTL